MGEAKRRKQQLGDAYGTPQGSNKGLTVYQGFDQSELDKKAMAEIANARRNGLAVRLMGTKAARPLAAAAGLPWLHEIAAGESIPESFAWDPEIAENGGPIPRVDPSCDAVCILGAGFSQWLESSLLGLGKEVTNA